MRRKLEEHTSSKESDLVSGSSIRTRTLNRPVSGVYYGREVYSQSNPVHPSVKSEAKESAGSDGRRREHGVPERALRLESGEKERESEGKHTVELRRCPS